MSTTSGAPRSSNKAKGQAAALGGAPRAVKPKSQSLVICGVTSRKQGWFFSDFVVFTTLLKENGVYGDFYTCFLNRHRVLMRESKLAVSSSCHERGKCHKACFICTDHFVHIKNDFSPGMNTVKFGKIGNGAGAIYEYSRVQDCRTNKFYPEVEPAKLTSVMRDWISDTISKVEPQEIVNIIILLLINLFSSACNSGYLVECVKNPGKANRYVSVATDKDELRITKKLREVSGTASQMTPAFNTDHDEQTPIAEIIFLDDATDAIVPVQQIEWPKVNATIQQAIANALITTPNTNVSHPPHALAVAQSEISLCDTSRGFPQDMDVYETLQTNAPNWKGLLANLYWRSFRQAAIWHLYLYLLSQGLVNRKCLTVPLDLFKSTPSTSVVTLLIRCFESVKNDIDKAYQEELPLQGAEWSADIEW
ncbi:hypothetical protein N7478_012000 [Penicillium angulare]|uniref:uncharacterized protein n=1 Tax=Penicillium angulare TaxID=116970 RepID=UPI002540ACC8|nr:uncharacterized protein N7478_012000 [Penicillium angulare]KAJ5261405.1 hypothetical protein N7478_012000 [Penicillium angulare]